MNNISAQKANYTKHRPRDINTKERGTSLSQYQSSNDSPIGLPRLGSTASKSRSAYITDSEERVKLSERLLASDPKAHIKLDGGYGDYSMAIFRVKDKKKFMRDIPTLFTSDRKAAIISSFPINTIDERSLQQFISRPRSLHKQISEEPTNDTKPESPLFRQQNKIAEIEDNMNGYLTLKQYPEHPAVYLGAQRVQIENTSGATSINKSTPMPKGIRTNSRLRTKGYMFKGLSRIQQR